LLEDFSYQGKIIYAVVTYTLLLLLYAANNLPYSALSGVITGDMGERNSLSSYRFVAVMFAQFFVQVFMLAIIEAAGHGDKAAGIEKVMTWLAIIGIIMLLITFFTTKELGEGTGLGLSISHRIIVDTHKGDMSFTSKPGQTSFQVRIPIIYKGIAQKYWDWVKPSDISSINSSSNVTQTPD